jgi:hypothetical protein
MPTKLSTKLLELVVDELVGDQPALSACALASSVLRRRARHHLFSNVVVTSLARATALVGFLDADPALGASVVSLLAWDGPPRDAWVGGPVRTGLCTLLQRLPHLAALELSSVDFVVLEPKCSVGALAAALPASLRQLAFSTCDFATDAGLVSLITAAPRLRSLVINSCGWSPSAAAPQGEAYAPAAQLEAFQLVSMWGDTEVGRPWLSVVSAHRFVSLTITLYGSSDVLFWQARIDRAGPTLRKLDLMNYNHSGAPHFSSFARYAPRRLHPAMNLDLSSLTMLRELIVASDQLPAFGAGVGEEPDLSLPLLRALMTVSSPCLERVTFRIDFPSPGLLTAVDWSILRTACEAVCARSPQLRVVLGLSTSPLRPPFDTEATDPSPTECERIAGEAIVAHGMEKMVFVERKRLDWRKA